MSRSKIHLRALPNVDFVHGYPGIPSSPERPQAAIRGTIEVRLGDQTIRVKWIKVELRKVETIPNGNHSEEFIDLIGQSPLTVWEAQNESETPSSKDFPFIIQIPESIPPSVALARGTGIKYEVVATLCMKGKKGLLRRETSTTVVHAVPVVIDKHELHSTWPVYTHAESHNVSSNGLTLVVNRSNTCFAPADRLGVVATLKSDNLSPVVLRAFEFSLRETIIYRAGSQPRNKKHGAPVQISVLGEQKVPVAMTLYGGTQHKAELGCIVPVHHTTSSVNTGSHIEIGYTLNIKAILDKGNPIVIDLPVKITNWPRHVSTDMMRRIGPAPSLGLIPLPASKMSGAALGRDPRLGPSVPRVQSVDNFPRNPNLIGHQAVPPGALVSGSPGLDVLGSPISSRNPHTSELHGTSESRSPVSQQIVHAPPRQNSLDSRLPDNIGGKTGGSSGEKTALTFNDDFSAPSGPVNEYGRKRWPGNAVPYTSDIGIIDVVHQPGSPVAQGIVSSQTIDSNIPVDDENKSPKNSHGVDVRASVSIRTHSSTRRRTASRTLKIVNATDDIPEEDSPLRAPATNSFDDGTRPEQPVNHQPPVVQSSSNRPWPTAEDEKRQLFDNARAQADRVQAQAKVNGLTSDVMQVQKSFPSADDHMPPVQQQKGIDTVSRTSSQSSVNSSWLTSRDEKRQLFEQAQANARLTQRLAQSPPQSPVANGSASRSVHQRTGSTNSVQDSGRRYVSTSPPSISAGAALYSHAIASMKHPIMVMPNVAQTSLTSSRTPASQRLPDGSSNQRGAIGDGQVGVRRPKEQVPPEDPIAYDALFPTGSSSAPSPSTVSQNTQIPGLSEKEVLRRAYEARDAALAANQPPLPASTLFAMSKNNETLLPHAWVTPLPAPSPTLLSEKELFRRASEARDTAMMLSGQRPQGSNTPVQSSVGGGSGLSPTGPKEGLSEKERMKLAFELRDRAVAAQQAPLPPEYGALPPTVSGSMTPPRPSSDAPMVSQAKAHSEPLSVRQGPSSYFQADVSTTKTPLAGEPVGFDHASSPTEESFKSESSEGNLRRDPSISAGKMRASQMITPSPPPPLPPPLLPRPPADYIEETKLEDLKNNLQAVTIGRLSPLEFDFMPLKNEQGPKYSSALLP